MFWSLGDKHYKDDKTHSEHKAPNTRRRTKIIMKDAGPVASPLKKAKNVFNLIFLQAAGEKADLHNVF